MSRRSAVIVPIALPRRLASVRDAGDAMAACGVPAHVTVLFPFVPPDALTPAIRSTLSALVADASSFTVPFDRLERRERRVWLIPSDQLPFENLTVEVSARWPQYPP